ncbi:molybdopterin-dependent oxidoreductase [Streptomyces sp. JV185]|uniref:molybdopterin-dependent oxidoreductase n=1 Tax=Streptomyces sp. JV185 TaxID=858638 RepID=UPI002E785938|nr:molybdopterin-dependent oxidoreductase [Streptomyces sp. JV185]MEE1771138.1 molybdopterin-dependent oxidoreductase [Streptomyces sp. JV185]
MIAGFCALAVAELAAALVRPEADPVTAVGGAVIDRTPPAVREFAVRNFGTSDKLVLQLGILILLALFAMAIGVLALRHRRMGSAAVLVFGLVGAVAAAGRPEGVPADALPSVVGAAVAVAVLYLLVGRLAPAPPPAAGEREQGVDGGFDRRGFVVAAATTAAASAGAGLLGRRLTSSVQAGAWASRHDLVLPAPRSAAPALPAGADLGIPGLSPFITPNKDFYRVDTALVVPRLDAAAWRLRIHGAGVARPVTVGLHDLLRREAVERDITLACVSNEVGGPLVGNARWLGVRLADLLRDAGVRPPSKGGPADQLVARSVDGMTIGTPVETVMDGRDAMLAFGMNGEPLPFEHGFPVRMVVPGLYGYVSACKWIADIELTTFAAYDAYWVRRDWAQQAPVKTGSRIDTPRPLASPKAGPVPVAGVAWAQHRGISRVEVRVDDGKWHMARLAAADTRDTWRQWVWEWSATPGRHTLQVRATDGTGATQTGTRTGTVPNGATGWHSVVVDVS